MIKTLFKKIGDNVVRVMAHDYECDHLEADGWVYSSEKAGKVETVKRGRKPKAVEDEGGESNQESASEDTGSGA